MFFYLRKDDDLYFIPNYSLILGEQKIYTNIFRIFLSIIWPITLGIIIYIKIKNKTMIINTLHSYKWILTFSFILLMIGWIGNKTITYYNQSVDLELQFNQLMEKRLSVVDRVEKIVHQKLQLAGLNDSSYYKSLTAVTLSRVDQPGLWAKLVVEQNPNINFSVVTAMYQDVSQSIQGERDLLFTVETELQKTNYNYISLRRRFPSNIYLFWRPAELNYHPISTTDNKIINISGVDQRVSL